MNNQNDNQPNPLMDQNNRKVVTIAGVILVVVVLGALLTSGRLGNRAPKEEVNEDTSKEEVVLPAGCKPGYKFSELTGEPCPVEDQNLEESEDRDSVIGDRSSGYDDKLKEYTGRIVLLDGSCNAVMSTQTFKKDTRILIANHSGSDHVVSFNGRVVNLRPYHYVTSFLNAEGSYNLSCDNAEIATVSVVSK